MTACNYFDRQIRAATLPALAHPGTVQRSRCLALHPPDRIASGHSDCAHAPFCSRIASWLGSGLGTLRRPSLLELFSRRYGRSP